MFRPREHTALNFFFIGTERFQYDGSDLGKLFDKLGHEFIKQSDHVMGYQYLAVHIDRAAVAAWADTVLAGGPTKPAW